MNPLTVIGSARPSSGPRSQPGYPISRLQRTNCDGAEATSAASRNPTTTIPASAVAAAASWTPGRRRPSAPCVRSAVAIVPRRLIRRGSSAGAPYCVSTSGSATEPSSRWPFSSSAMIVRPTATAVPLSVCTAPGLPPLGPVADVEAPRLVVGRVRARGQLAVALLPGQPRLEVVLLAPPSCRGRRRRC